MLNANPARADFLQLASSFSGVKRRRWKTGSRLTADRLVSADSALCRTSCYRSRCPLRCSFLHTDRRRLIDGASCNPGRPASFSGARAG